jgi:hypothetical protein
MRRFLANILFLFLGLPLVLSTLFLISARPWALDRETYKRFVDDDRLYAALRAPEMASRAPRNIELGPAGGNGEKLRLEGPALVAAAQKDMPWPELRATASRAVDSVLDAVEGKAGGTLELDLRALKASLRQKVPALARDYIAGATASELPKNADSAAEIAALLGGYVDAMPDRAVAPPPPDRRRIGGPIGVMSRGPTLERGLSQAILNRMTATMAAVSALLIAGLGALGGTGLVSRLSRAGRYLLLPSILVLGAGIALAIPGGLILQNVLPREFQDMVAGSAGAQLRDYLAAALGPIARNFFITGLVGTSLGGVLTQTRRFAEPKELE